MYFNFTSPYMKESTIPNDEADGKGNKYYFNYIDYSYLIKITFIECTKYEIITDNSIQTLSNEVKKCTACPDLSYSKNQ